MLPNFIARLLVCAVILTAVYYILEDNKSNDSISELKETDQIEKYIHDLNKSNDSISEFNETDQIEKCIHDLDIVYVNLDSRIDRRQNMEYNLGKLVSSSPECGYQYRRFDAFSIKDITLINESFYEVDYQIQCFLFLVATRRPTSYPLKKT